MWFMLAGMGLQMLSQQQAGKKQEELSKYNAALLEQNAVITAQTMEAETARANKNARRLKGSQRAAYGKSGAMIDSGTPLLVMAEQAGAMQKDILNERRNRMLEIQSLHSQAEVARMGGDAAQQAAKLGMASTLLNTGASMYGSRSQGGSAAPSSSGAQNNWNYNGNTSVFPA